MCNSLSFLCEFLQAFSAPQQAAMSAKRRIVAARPYINHSLIAFGDTVGCGGRGN
jgi:hypothetical protein